MLMVKALLVDTPVPDAVVLERFTTPRNPCGACLMRDDRDRGTHPTECPWTNVRPV